jgi:hypothetical protein
MRKEKCWKIQQKRNSSADIAQKTNVYWIAKYVLPEEVIVIIVIVRKSNKRLKTNTEYYI